MKTLPSSAVAVLLALSLTSLPLASLQVADAGIARADRIGNVLNDGDLDPASFNETLRRTPDLAQVMGSVTAVGNFVVSQVEDGLRGEEHAGPIHDRLRQDGISAGGLEAIPGGSSGTGAPSGSPGGVSPGSGGFVPAGTPGR